jgi:hypothetical protein
MPGGYQCVAGGHGVTDELLAEGKGGVFVMRTRDWKMKEGPYYPHPDLKRKGEFYGPSRDGGSVRGFKNTVMG